MDKKTLLIHRDVGVFTPMGPMREGSTPPR